MAGRGVLLDTNIIIGIFANDSSILDRLRQTDEVFIPSVALGELYYGAYKSAHPQDNAGRIDQLATNATVLFCDTTTARHYGLIKANLRAKGKPLPENNIWIASIAKHHDLVVVSRDQHFQEIDELSVEVW